MRIAVAGAIKAGKSTLLNALVGEDIAPTDATECTRVVTWFRHGAKPAVTATDGRGHATDIPVRRRGGGLTFDLGQLTARDVDRIDVEWPTARLVQTTLIDTPGTTSLSTEVSARTLDLLIPDEGNSAADAVIYLFRSLDESDLDFLRQISGNVAGGAGPLGVIGVVSRADELGVGRVDAMHSARQIAKQFTRELELTGLCQTAVPVAGLVAFTAKTLRQHEYNDLRELSAVAPDQLELALLSADRFVRTETLPTDCEARAQLIRRLGPFGIRIALTCLRAGAPDCQTLVDDLLYRSGVTELEHVIDVHFGQRADDLKAHNAARTLKDMFAAHPATAAAPLVKAVDELVANVHGFQELRLLAKLRSTPTTLRDVELTDIRRILGSYGTEPAQRLDIDAFAVTGVGMDHALGEVNRWRAKARHPMTDQFTAGACMVAARSAEHVLARLRDSAAVGRASGM
nr:dynamin family protein [Mycolicibacterium litorale]